MHDHQPCVAPQGNIHHCRIREARHVIDDGGARFHARLGNLGMSRVNAHAYSQVGKLANNVENARELLLHAYLCGARAPGLAAHIDDLCTRIHHGAGMLYRRCEIGVRAPVRERIGCHVEDAHNHRHARVELERSTFPHHSKGPFARMRAPKTRNER